MCEYDCCLHWKAEVSLKEDARSNQFQQMTSMAHWRSKIEQCAVKFTLPATQFILMTESYLVYAINWDRVRWNGEVFNTRDRYLRSGDSTYYESWMTKLYYPRPDAHCRSQCIPIGPPNGHQRRVRHRSFASATCNPHAHRFSQLGKSTLRGTWHSLQMVALRRWLSF